VKRKTHSNLLGWPAFGVLVLFLVRHHDNIGVVVAVDSMAATMLGLDREDAVGESSNCTHEQLLHLLDVIHWTGSV
jgi:hypothetical protein